MPRPKKVALVATETKPPKEKKIIITREQLDLLTKASEQVTDARRAMDAISRAETIAEIGFIAGQAFFAVNQVEDLLDDLVSDLTPEDESDNNWGDLDI